MNSSSIQKENVDRFLELIKKSRRGHFKIYLGMAAGVGKTYRMLMDARNMLQQGIDVVIGLIESHGRAETEKLSEGIPFIPRKRLYYRGEVFEELDTEAILKRHPEVVLLDELAHSNIPGCRNQKRYEDIEELLKSGISVISTLNIQHIESLNVMIDEITGIKVKECVPDSILKLADEVVNIDLTVDELVTRLKSGKIYEMKKVNQALLNFFRPENLLQLRELVLREVASLVERKIDNEIIPSLKKSSEKILSCISTNEKSARAVIHKSARIVSKFDSEWFIIYIQTEKEAPDKINLALQRRLINNMKLATQLGGKVIKKVNNNVAVSIITFAKEKGINRMIIGNPKKNSIFRLFSRKILNELISLAQKNCIDITIVC